MKDLKVLHANSKVCIRNQGKGVWVRCVCVCVCVCCRILFDFIMPYALVHLKDGKMDLCQEHAV